MTGCNSEPNRKIIMVNKTAKVFSRDYHDKAENYTFKWTPPIGPNNKQIIFDLKNDMLLFTPIEIGKYDVTLSIEDISQEVVEKQRFYFIAIPETTEVAIIMPKKDIPVEPKKNASINKTIKNKKKPKKKKNKKPKKKPITKEKKQPSHSKSSNIEYALQISAWPSLEEARTHQLKLIDEGFDAYTQRFYFQKKDEVWYRVRVGNFSNMDKAFKIKKQIESFIGIKTWLDVVSTK